MIPAFAEPWEPGLWQRLLKEAVRDNSQLLHVLDLEAPEEADLTPEFPVRVPAPYLKRMRPGDLQDPLLRQVFAVDAERSAVSGYCADPLGEAEATRAPGLIQKYAGRALLVTTQACAVHCRYCFRRAFPYESHRQPGWTTALAELRSDPGIEEIILSGGDPLTLTDAAISDLITELDAIPHIARIRIHTRLPVVLPQRVTATLLELLAGVRAGVVMVVHANHPNELDADTARAFALLHAAGCTLLNQSVLLKGVNSDVDTLAALSFKLFDQRVLPYYVHLLDAVAGAAHFDTPDADARLLQNDLRDRLPGYLMPRFVKEVPGVAAKQPLI